MNKLYIFDMDGTLLPRTTASLEIAKITNTLTELHELERRFIQEKLPTREFAKYIHELWGLLHPTVIEAAFSAAPKLKNISETLSVIKERGDVSCLITMSPDFFADCFYPYGFDHIVASPFPRQVEDQIDLDKILKPEDKPRVSDDLARAYGLDFNASVAFGDSMSDYPLFQQLRHTVAVNGTADLKKVSTHHYDGDDLYQAFLMTESCMIPA